MFAQDFVAVISAIGVAILGLLPIYQKWREIQRAEAVADHEKGVDTFNQVVSQTLGERSSRITMFLSFFIFVAITYNLVRGNAIAIMVERQYEEFTKIKDEVNKRRLSDVEYQTKVLTGFDYQNKMLEKEIQMFEAQNKVMDNQTKALENEVKMFEAQNKVLDEIKKVLEKK